MTRTARCRSSSRSTNVAGAIERLVGLGASELTPPDAQERPGEVIARLRDPAGNVLGLVADA